MALAGVYQADAGLLGELRYFAGRLKGEHCALCDITHTLRGERPTFAPIRARLRLQTWHLNEQPPALAAVTAGRTPCVAAQTAEGWRVVLGSPALGRCGRSVEAFEVAILNALQDAGLMLSTDPTLSDGGDADPSPAG
ncbi:MAG: hypothetical protein ACI9U2_002210 [Bradymonadia bacterium]